MTSVQTTPLEKPLIQYKLEPTSLPIVLEYLNKNKLSSISSNTKIIKYDLDKIIPYGTFSVDGKLEDDTKYTYYLHKKDYYKVLEVYKIPKHINRELEAFTLDYKKATYYKKQSLYNMVLLDKTRFDVDVTNTEDKIKANLKKYSNTEAELEGKKAVLENKWNTERDSLYDQKNKLIHANKDLYRSRLKISKEFYERSKEQQLETRAKFLENYRINLTNYSTNRDSIVELNDQIELLEKKAGLYISETFFYYPTSILIIKSLDKDIYNTLVKDSKKVGGGSDIENMISSKKKVEYELEYLDLDNLEDQSNSMSSYYRNIKERIKKVSKKNKDINNKELFRNITKEIVA
jgi:hypothetical protein